MATYGKTRKKSILPSFSVLHDDAASGKGQSSKSQYRKLDSENALRHQSNSSDADEDSFDELANALIETPPRFGSLLNFRSTTHGPQSARKDRGHTKITKVSISSPDKAPDAFANNPFLTVPSHPAPRSRKLRKPVKHKEKSHHFQVVRPGSTPEPTEVPLPKSPFLPAGISLPTKNASIHAPKPISNSADAAEVNEKILKAFREQGILSQADVSTRHSPRQVRKVQQEKITPLQRGRNAIRRAGRAISHQVTSADRGGRIRVESSPLKPNLSKTRDQSSDTDTESTEQQINRRIAEGENLANPKIKLLTGDGKIQRKPHPSSPTKWTALRKLSNASDNPFSDRCLELTEFEQKRSPTLGLEHFERRNAQPITLSCSSPTDHALETFDTPLRSSTGRLFPNHRFSSTLSGLSQHPDVMTFATPPVDSSTPRVRLESHTSATGKSRLGTVLVKGPSSLDFANNLAYPNSPDELQYDQHISLETNPSLKRKTGNSNLRRSSSPISKKHKSSSGISDETKQALARGLAQLTTSERAILVPKDSNKRHKRSTILGFGSKGLGIFDISKGKEPMYRIEQENVGFSNSSSDLPSFRDRAASDARYKHRASLSFLEQRLPLEDDSMSLDELNVGGWF
ncbi:hypothetical protein MMC25_002058 [Agyrium rufum]|nr:hypothetical protein [Agyrium rufum]